MMEAKEFVTSGNTAVSVIMSAYNVGRVSFFEDVMKSILLQSIYNLEFIICDNGSTDQTSSVLTDFAQRDRRITVFRNKKNLWHATALNQCLKIARGKFIARQDIDDISDPMRLEKQITYLEAHKEVSFVGSNVYLFDSDGIWGVHTFPLDPTKKDFLFKPPFQHGALTFRRECLLSVNGYHEAPETRRTEDYDLLMRLYSAGYLGHNIQEQLYSFLEDNAAQARRKYSYRIDEIKVRARGFSQLGMMPWAAPYVLKPAIVGLIPARLLKKLKLRFGSYSLIKVAKR